MAPITIPFATIPAIIAASALAEKDDSRDAGALPCVRVQTWTDGAVSVTATDGNALVVESWPAGSAAGVTSDAQWLLPPSSIDTLAAWLKLLRATDKMWERREASGFHGETAMVEPYSEYLTIASKSHAEHPVSVPIRVKVPYPDVQRALTDAQGAFAPSLLGLCVSAPSESETRCHRIRYAYDNRLRSAVEEWLHRDAPKGRGAVTVAHHGERCIGLVRHYSHDHQTDRRALIMPIVLPE